LISSHSQCIVLEAAHGLYMQQLTRTSKGE
jgi:hypothetical protein